MTTNPLQLFSRSQQALQGLSVLKSYQQHGPRFADWLGIQSATHSVYESLYGLVSEDLLQSLSGHAFWNFSNQKESDRILTTLEQEVSEKMKQITKAEDSYHQRLWEQQVVTTGGFPILDLPLIDRKRSAVPEWARVLTLEVTPQHHETVPLNSHGFSYLSYDSDYRFIHTSKNKDEHGNLLTFEFLFQNGRFWIRTPQNQGFKLKGILSSRTLKPNHLWPLRDGDMISIGNLSFKVRLPKPSKLEKLASQIDQADSLEKLSHLLKQKGELELAQKIEKNNLGSLPEGGGLRVKAHELVLSKAITKLHQNYLKGLISLDAETAQTLFIGVFMAVQKASTPDQLIAAVLKSPLTKIALLAPQISAFFAGTAGTLPKEFGIEAKGLEIRAEIQKEQDLQATSSLKDENQRLRQQLSDQQELINKNGELRRDLGEARQREAEAQLRAQREDSARSAAVALIAPTQEENRRLKTQQSDDARTIQGLRDENIALNETNLRVSQQLGERSESLNGLTREIGPLRESNRSRGEEIERLNRELNERAPVKREEYERILQQHADIRLDRDTKRRELETLQGREKIHRKLIQNLRGSGDHQTRLVIDPSGQEYEKVEGGLQFTLRRFSDDGKMGLIFDLGSQEIPGPNISKNHLHFEFYDGQWGVRDVGSAVGTGTLLNDEPIHNDKFDPNTQHYLIGEEHAIEHGSVLTVGSVRLQLREGRDGETDELVEVRRIANYQIASREHRARWITDEIKLYINFLCRSQPDAIEAVTQLFTNLSLNFGKGFQEILNLKDIVEALGKGTINLLFDEAEDFIKRNSHLVGEKGIKEALSNLNRLKQLTLQHWSPCKKEYVESLIALYGSNAAAHQVRQALDSLWNKFPGLEKILNPKQLQEADSLAKRRKIVEEAEDFLKKKKDTEEALFLRPDTQRELKTIKETHQLFVPAPREKVDEIGHLQSFGERSPEAAQLFADVYRYFGMFLSGQQGAPVFTPSLLDQLDERELIAHLNDNVAAILEPSLWHQAHEKILTGVVETIQKILAIKSEMQTQKVRAIAVPDKMPEPQPLGEGYFRASSLERRNQILESFLYRRPKHAFGSQTAVKDNFKNDDKVYRIKPDGRQYHLDRNKKEAFSPSGIHVEPEKRLRHRWVTFDYYVKPFPLSKRWALQVQMEMLPNQKCFLDIGGQLLSLSSIRSNSDPHLDSDPRADLKDGEYIIMREDLLEDAFVFFEAKNGQPDRLVELELVPSDPLSRDGIKAQFDVFGSLYDPQTASSSNIIDAYLNLWEKFPGFIHTLSPVRFSLCKSLAERRQIIEEAMEFLKKQTGYEEDFQIILKTPQQFQTGKGFAADVREDFEDSGQKFSTVFGNQAEKIAQHFADLYQYFPEFKRTGPEDPTFTPKLLTEQSNEALEAYVSLKIHSFLDTRHWPYKAHHDICDLARVTVDEILDLFKEVRLSQPQAAASRLAPRVETLPAETPDEELVIEDPDDDDFTKSDVRPAIQSGVFPNHASNLPAPFGLEPNTHVDHELLLAGNGQRVDSRAPTDLAIRFTSSEIRTVIEEQISDEQLTPNQVINLLECVMGNFQMDHPNINSTKMVPVVNLQPYIEEARGLVLKKP